MLKTFYSMWVSGLHTPLYYDYFKNMPGWLRQMDGLIFYSNEYQDINFARANGLRSLHLIPNGADEREFGDSDDHDIRRRMDIAPDNDLFICVGSRTASKGHWEVIRAFDKADLERSATLVINANTPIGSLFGAIKRQFKHVITGRFPLSWVAWMCNIRQAGKRVKIVDLNREDLVSLYKAADLFVTASHVEYSPLVLFEAAAAGTAFIASSAGNSQEIANWTQDGVVLRSAGNRSAKVSIDDLARELRNIFICKSKFHEMGNTARAKV